MPKTPTATPHKQLLRHLLMARSDWMEARVVQGAHLEGYPHLTTAMNRLHNVGGRYALCTMCIGVGQGIALIIEKV